MKLKILTIATVIAFSTVLFFNANSTEFNSDTDLASLIAMNVANAENGNGCNGNYTRSVRNYNITSTPENKFKKYDEDDCIKKWCEYATLSGWCCFYD